MSVSGLEIYQKLNINIFRFSVREFLGRVCKYGRLRDVITPNLNKICTFLEQNPHYGGIDQLEIDFNLIEVSGFTEHKIYILRHVCNRCHLTRTFMLGF